MHPLEIDEDERVKALRALEILGTSSETHLDAVCRIAASLYDIPMAFVTLIDDRHVWIKARYGSDAQCVPRVDAFCDETIRLADGEALVLPDLAAHERYRDCVLVTGTPNARFYAGVPIALQSGLHIGTLCLMDVVARPDFGEAQVRQLQDLARIVEAHLRLHESRLNQEKEERRYRLLADTTTDIIIWSDLDTTRRYVSPAAKAVLGYEPEELVGTRPLDFVHPDDAAAYSRVLDDLSNERIERAVTTQRYRHKNGCWVWIEVSFCLTRDGSSSRATGYVASLRDVSDRKEIEDALRISEERLALALDSGSDGFWDWDIASNQVRLAGRWAALLGYGDNEIASHVDAWRGLIHQDDAAQFEQAQIDHLGGLTPRLDCEYRLRTKTGNYVWTLARGKVVARDTNGSALRMVGTHMDITQRKEAEQKIAHMATHDALTGLPNRTLFRERLDTSIGNAARHKQTFAVLACDLDGFKGVNDTLGHSAGDLLLKTIAERLKAMMREQDTIARLGGDEFAIILVHLNQAEDASVTASRVIEAIGLPIDIDGHLTNVGVSIGIALGPTNGRDAESLFKNADIALYRAKAAGRNTYRFYEPGMDVLAAERSCLERDMRDALRNGGFSLHYQPLINLNTGAIQSFEALLRWHHPTRGLVSPTEFIPIAEETGLVVSLGEWALHEACREAATWPQNIRIAVNVSTVQFQQPGLEQSILKALARSGLAANRLELEITESVLMRDAPSVISCLHRLREVGVRVALDDFGTGYSSLSYLRQFPFNKIKIDRTFVRDIAEPDTAAIVRAVVGLGVRAGATITAEGVETQEQLSLLRREGCHEVQGYLFSAPLRIDDVRRMIVHLQAA